MSSLSSEERLIQAARWRIRLSELDLETAPEFQAWLAEPGSTEAWAQVNAPWNFLGGHGTAPEALAARQAALQDARSAMAEPAPRQRWLSYGGIAAALLLAVAAAWGVIQWRDMPQDYATARGERRIITLSDGSRVALDSGSEVTVRYSGDTRQLALLRGQARFDVAHDVTRPFWVSAGGQKVIATGTAFNIDLTGPRVLVTLIEGRVVVMDEKSGVRTDTSLPRQTVELAAGQQLTVTPDRVPGVGPANIQRITAWMNGQLMFDNEPLSDVVERVNRYTARPIEIHDPNVGAMRVSGVFNTGDLAGVLDIVTHYLPVRAVEGAGGVVVLERQWRAKGRN